MGRNIQNTKVSNSLKRLMFISRQYRECLYSETHSKQIVFSFYEEDVEEESPRHFILRVNQTLNAMSAKEREFMRNVFFSPQSEEWWNAYFCYATFSRMQRRACRNFLEGFDR